MESAVYEANKNIVQDVKAEKRKSSRAPNTHGISGGS
jgi:hypothetical protein